MSSYLSAFRDRLVMEVQDARSRCRSLEQNLLRLVHVLEENREQQCAGFTLSPAHSL